MEVSQKDKILGVLEAGKAFGELAILYNCRRTASVKGRCFLYFICVSLAHIKRHAKCD